MKQKLGPALKRTKRASKSMMTTTGAQILKRLSLLPMTKNQKVVQMTGQALVKTWSMKNPNKRSQSTINQSNLTSKPNHQLKSPQTMKTVPILTLGQPQLKRQLHLKLHSKRQTHPSQTKKKTQSKMISKLQLRQKQT